MTSLDFILVYSSFLRLLARDTRRTFGAEATFAKNWKAKLDAWEKLAGASSKKRW